MRIVIAGPPKTGNVWLKCLLASMYELRPLGPARSPDAPTLDSFLTWVDRGLFQDGTVFHQHYDFSDALVDAISAVPAHTVTIVRDPYDAFVSSFYTNQKHAGSEVRRQRKISALAGKEIDHPDVLSWLRRGGFRNHLVKANAWVGSGRTIVLRYETLLADPAAELKGLTGQLGPVSDERISRAIEKCSADAMRQNSRTAGHVRIAKVGDSKRRLNDDHLEIFRDQYADLITRLGYEVRVPHSS
jgi:Sulfotransferase domain